MKRKTRERRSRTRSSLRLGTVRDGILALALFIASTSSTPAIARDLSADRFTLRGFGTLGATTHDADHIEFRRTNGQAQGAKADDIDFGVDSLAGAQIDVKLGTRFDAVAQLLTRQQNDGSWKPRLSQGFLRYSPDQSLSLRAGRIGYDIYLLAESRQVGYSYLPARPTPEFYGQITNDDIDGGDISYTRRLGPGVFRGRLFAGDSVGELAFENDVRTESKQQISGGTFDYAYRGWMWRVAAVSFSYEAGDDIRPLIGGLRATQFPSALAIATDLDQQRFRSQGVQLGMAYDDGPMLAQVLYGVVRSDSIAGPEYDKFYGLFGYRVRNWTPFVSHVRSEDVHPVRDAGLPPLAPFAPLNAAVVQIQDATRSTQYTTSIGVRYDFSSRIAFKVQLDRAHVEESSLFLDYRADATAPYDMTVLAATVDFVF